MPIRKRKEQEDEGGLVAANDLASPYMAHREKSVDDDAVRDLLERVGGDDQEEAAVAEPAEAAPIRGPRGRAPVREGAKKAGTETARAADQEEESTVGSVLSDVGRGIVEGVPQAVGGIRDAVQEAIEGGRILSDWYLEHTDMRSFEDLVEEAAPAELRGGPKVGEINLPEIPDPKTATGGVIRSAAQFLTGFIPALKGLRAAGVTAPVVGSMAAGGIADFAVFDPHEARLSDLWQEMGLPENRLTDFLASDPEDSEKLGRFKNLVEGALVGGGAELIAKGVVTVGRLLRAVRGLKKSERADTVRTTAEATAAEQAEQFGTVSDRDFLILGDPTQPLFRVASKEAPDAAERFRAAEEATETGVPDDVAAKGLTKTGEAGGEEVFVNFSRIDTPDDVKNVIGQMTDAFSANIDEARRGVQSHEATQQLADELGMSVPDILSRRKGQPFNAEEALAARRLWAASAEKLLETARKASGPNAGEIDQFNFRRMLAIHHAIQAEVIGARTETARALNAWAIPAKGGTEKARAIEQLMESMGGPEASRAMAKRLAILAEQDAGPEAIHAFARRGWGSRTADAIKEVWVNGLLSSPKTHIVNISSNSAVAVQQIYERKVAELIGGLRGDISGVAPGEAAAMTFGLTEGLKDAFRLSWKALQTGETGRSLHKIDLPRERAISAGKFEGTALGHAIDFLGATFRVPGRLLGAEDEFFKTIGYRMELYSQAVRQATEEGFKDGDLAARMHEIIQNPPEHIRIAAADAALYNTFTNQPGIFGRKLLSLRNIDHPLNPLPFILPFMRTPVNIARYAFERTPLAPLVSQWRADIAAGGARKDLALARMSTGTAIMLTAADFADSGVISGRGPEDPGELEAQKRLGWQPYSIKIGDRWYSYNRADPFGMTMGFAADIAEAIRRGDIDEDDVDEWQEVVAMGITAISQVTINKTYLSGIAEFTEMVANPQRYSASYINDFVGSFVPFTSLAGAIETAVDPTLSEVNTPADAVFKRIAFLSDRLPRRRDLWGRAIRSESGLGKTYDFFSPVTAREIKDSPIDAEIVRLNADVRRIKKKSSFDGVRVNFRDWPEVFEEYQRLAGNELKHPAWGLGAKDLLDKVVSGDHPLSAIYQIRSDGKDGGKAAFIDNTIADYRKLARQAILSDPRFADFAAHVGGLKAEKSAKQMPVLQ